MDLLGLASLISIGAGCVASIAYLRLGQRYNRQKKQLAMLNSDLDKALRCLNGIEEQGKIRNFQTSLADEQVTVRLRQGCLTNYSGVPESARAPEKYRHVSTLADHGLTAHEIAEVINISAVEAEQLIKLLKFTQPAD